MTALFSAHMGEYFAETGRSPADLRQEMLAGPRQPFGMDAVLRRGVERGEIDPAQLTGRIVNLPLDLLRHDMLPTLRPVPDEAIAEIVDRIFLPLVAV